MTLFQLKCSSLNDRNLLKWRIELKNTNGGPFEWTNYFWSSKGKISSKKWIVYLWKQSAMWLRSLINPKDLNCTKTIEDGDSQPSLVKTESLVDIFVAHSNDNCGAVNCYALSASRSRAAKVTFTITV